jgi:hypothetical protein
LELEIGARAFIRAGEQTQIGVANLEPDFLQVEVKAGSASVDVRSIPAGHTVEIDTPNAAFTIENSGYYRIDVDEDTTTFTTRRGGRASVTPAAGSALAVASSETVVVQGTDNPTVETYMAPDMDDWDRWNYTRTDQLIDSMSARYVSPDVYGTDDLDHYGRWRVVPTYGSVWVPAGVAPGWAPYSTGRWILDPYYGWTWIDDAPWGWAPYHYGRWVFVDGFWAWAPGPVARTAGLRAGARRVLRRLGRPAFTSASAAGLASAGSRSAGASLAIRGGDRATSGTSRGGAAGADRTATGTMTIGITTTTVTTMVMITMVITITTMVTTTDTTIRGDATATTMRTPATTASSRSVRKASDAAVSSRCVERSRSETGAADRGRSSGARRPQEHDAGRGDEHSSAERIGRPSDRGDAQAARPDPGARAGGSHSQRQRLLHAGDARRATEARSGRARSAAACSVRHAGRPRARRAARASTVSRQRLGQLFGVCETRAVGSRLVVAGRKLVTTVDDQPLRSAGHARPCVPGRRHARWGLRAQRNLRKAATARDASAPAANARGAAACTDRAVAIVRHRHE